MYWLDVPYDAKEAAKSLGARWDPAHKRWFSTVPPEGGLAKWAARPDLPELLPGEDRTFGGGLFVDLVPTSCWFTNVRSCVSQQDWERLRRMVLSRAGNRCEACGAGEDRVLSRWLEAHERWEYDTATLTQTLRRIICLCTDCHTATHYGFAELQGKAREARHQLALVNGWTDAQIEEHIDDAWFLWSERSEHDWKLDLSILTSVDVEIVRPPEPQQRRMEAAAQLQGQTTGPNIDLDPPRGNAHSIPSPGVATAPPPVPLPVPTATRAPSAPRYPHQTPLPHTVPPRRTDTNGAAIASLVCAFLLAPLAVIFGHVALVQIKHTGQRGNGLAVAGLILGYLPMVLFAAWLVLFVAYGGSGTPR